MSKSKIPKQALNNYLDSCNKEGEEFHKNLISNFLKKTYYKDNHFINTKESIDLAIYNSASSSSTVGIIVKTKSPANKTEMVKPDNLNTKAFHGLIYYYLLAMIANNNLEVKNLIITNVYEWYIFDASIFENLFYFRYLQV